MRRRPENDGFAPASAHGNSQYGYGYARQRSGENYFQRYFQRGSW